MMEPLAWIDAATRAGWLRPLDRVLARFIAAGDTTAEPLAVLAAALASHQYGRGHICLELEALTTDANGTLDLPPEGELSNLSPPRDLIAGLSPDIWRVRLQASAAVTTGDGAEPLVLDGSRLYLRRYWTSEQAVADGIARRMTLKRPEPQPLRELLQRYFGPATTTLDWQRIAAALAVGNRFMIISGGPGTGKTTTVARLLAVLQEHALTERGLPLRLDLAAPTGKAAARLGESLGNALGELDCPPAVAAALTTTATTLHRLLGARPDTRRLRYHRHNPLHTDLVIVDEASMVDVELMAALFEALPAQTRVILLGDRDQLASVEAGAVLGDLCANAESPGYSAATRNWLAAVADAPALPGDQRGGLAEHITLLRHSYRFESTSGIGALANAVNAGDTTATQAVLSKGHSDLRWLTLSGIDDPALERYLTDGYADFLACLATPNPEPVAVLAAFNHFRALCSTRRGHWGTASINQRLWRVLLQHELINSEEDNWYRGRAVMIRRNDHGLGLYNGDVGIALPEAATGRLRVYFKGASGEPPRAILPSRLDAVETAFAMTVHKSQGSEFEHVAVILPERIGPIFTRELLYTAITRARQRLTLVGRDRDVIATAATRRVRRASGLSHTLQQRLGTFSPIPISNSRDCS